MDHYSPRSYGLSSQKRNQYTPEPLQSQSPARTNVHNSAYVGSPSRSPFMSSPSPTKSPGSKHQFPNDDISLMRSSSMAFRHLDQLGDTEDVAGMHGRVRLRADNKSWAMDKQRKSLQAYEYLCHIGEAKEWIEACIQEEIPEIVKLEEGLRDGVVLAKLTRVFAPHLVRRIFESPRLQFRHSENINYFFKFLDEIGMPDLFTFELTDIYDKKNIPKVIYCVHALGYILSTQGLAPPIGDLVGKLEFTEDEILDTQRGLDAKGINLPNFKGMNQHFGAPEPEPVPPEELMAQQLLQWEPQLTLLQSAIRANFARTEMEYKIYGLKYLAKDEIIQLQSVARGNWLRQSLASRAQDLQNNRALAKDMSMFQALVRGSIVRRQVERKLDILHYEVAPHIASLQSIIRGAAQRKRFADDSEKMSTQMADVVVSLQSTARGFLFRQKERGLKQVLESEIDSVVAFQSLVRAIPTRNRCALILTNLCKHEQDILDLQSIIRAARTRSQVENTRQSLRLQESSILTLQSIIRSKGIHGSVQSKIDTLADNASWITNLQSVIRGFVVRDKFKDVKAQLVLFHEDIGELQSICRGYLVRDDINKGRTDLKAKEDLILDIQSIYRAGLVRAQVSDVLDRLELVSPSIIRLQSIFRGVLTRFEYSLLQEDLEDALPEIMELQSIAKGHLVRKEFNERMEHYKKNLDSVIKIQSFVRAKKQGDAYRSLISQPNPPLSTVKSFVHLLNDSDLDFEQEMELEQQRKKVIDEVRNNEMLEQFINQLEVKIALLLKNKITIDELVKHRNKGVKNDMSNENSFDLKALNKSSRRRLELYQGLFYILQTQPVYLCRLFNRLRQTVISDKEMKDIEGMIMTLFGYAQKPREEFFLLQLVGKCVREDINASESTRSFARTNYLWWKLVAALNRDSKSRLFLKNLLRPVVSRIVEQPDLDMESDPLAIYRTSINNEELRTGRLSQRDPNVPVDVAIQDPETRSTFIANLQKLRETTTEFLNVVEESVDSLPYYIRYLAMIVFKEASSKFEGESADRVGALIGHVLFTNYLNPAIVAADNFGIVSNALSPQQSKNLNEIARVLTQASSLRPFSKDNVYLQPLNDYLKSSFDRIKQIFARVVDINDLEHEFGLTSFDDLTSHRRPNLYIKSTDILALHSVIRQDVDAIAPDPEDSLRSVVKDLGELPRDASEVLNNVARFTEVKLDLNPSFSRVEDPDAEINSLVVAAKRCLLYVLRVQNGADLMDVLVSPVSPEHEEKYKAILREERKESGKKKTLAYSGATALGDLSRISYRELKLLALEKVLELEAMGKISREDNYQELLNSIAVDIKMKRNKRMSREREMDGIHQTLSSLAEKEEYLQNQLKTYNDYIEQAMSTLQTRKSKKKALVLPFSRQYFHMRDLQRTGRVPKFGSYKYTASNLHERGVLVELQGYTERQLSQVTFTFSSDQVGVFNIEAANGAIAIPGASVELTLDDLLGQQYNNNQYIHLFDNMVKLNTNLTLHFIFKKFYGESNSVFK